MNVNKLCRLSVMSTSRKELEDKISLAKKLAVAATHPPLVQQFRRRLAELEQELERLDRKEQGRLS